MKTVTAIFLLSFSSVIFAELEPLSIDDLQGTAAQAGVTVEVLTNSNIDLYYVNEGNSGGAVKIEGVKIVKTNATTGAVDPNSSSAVITRFDVASSASSPGGGISVASSFEPNSAIKVDAIRLGSVGNATGNTAFQNAYANINSATPASSLGQLSITGLSGTAIVNIRAQ